jgi:hypothetical protein
MDIHTSLWNPDVINWQKNEVETINPKIDVLCRILINYTEALTLQEQLKLAYGGTPPDTQFSMYEGFSFVLRAFNSKVQIGVKDRGVIMSAANSVKNKIDEILALREQFRDGQTSLPQKKNQAQQIIEEEEIIEHVKLLCKAMYGVTGVSHNILLAYQSSDQKQIDFLRGIDRALVMWGLTPDVVNIINSVQQEELEKAIVNFENYVTFTITRY